MAPAVEGTTDESDAWAMSPCFPTRLHAQAGAILGLHPRLHAGARPAAGRSRFATILPGDAAFSPPDGAHARTQRPDPPSARHRSEHQGVGRSRSTAALTRQLRSTRQILCAELLVAFQRQMTDEFASLLKVRSAREWTALCDRLSGNEIHSQIGRNLLFHYANERSFLFELEEPALVQAWRQGRRTRLTD